MSSLILPAGDVADAARPAANRATRAAARMRRELERAREAPRLRAIADALMALGTDAPIPAQVILPDGGSADVPRSDDPHETPVALAERLYREVKGMERALERLPARIDALEADPAAATVTRGPQRCAGSAAGRGQATPLQVLPLVRRNRDPRRARSPLERRAHVRDREAR